MLKLPYSRRMKAEAKNAVTRPTGQQEALGDDEASRSVDRFLKLAGLALAVVSGLLPWAAYERSTSAQHVAVSGQTIKDPLDRSHQHTFLFGNSSRHSATHLADVSVDPSPTGALTTGDTGSGRPRAEPPGKQPFPARPEFLLRDVVNGMGMIEDQTGFWFVEKGSLLPDASHVAAITNHDGVWEITTDTGRTIRQTR